MEQRAKFRGRDNAIVVAELVDVDSGAWEIVTYEKKSVPVYRNNRANPKKLGKALKEVRTVLEKLENKEFKRAYYPANYAAVDMYDLTDYPEPAPKKAAQIPKPKTGGLIDTSKPITFSKNK
jgi:hypothetical protein